MQAAREVFPEELFDFLLNMAIVNPVMIWGAPGIGKTSIVNQFAEAIGMECVSLLGSSLAPEDVIGVPKVEDNVSKFFPPSLIVRDKPFVLFLDELNACSQEVQKSFYSLILDQKAGEYCMPKGSIVIAAGNRAEDAAIVKPMSSALINRLFHVTLKPSSSAWIKWAEGNEEHPLVIDYVRMRPDHLWSKPPKTEEPFSTPRSWHFLSQSLKAWPSSTFDAPSGDRIIEVLAHGWLTPKHADMFVAFHRQRRRSLDLGAIIRGDMSWPDKPEERDVLLFLVEAFRSRLIKELPEDKSKLSGEAKELSLRAKDMLVSLSRISFEMAQLVLIPNDQGNTIPDWLTVEIARDLPRLSGKVVS